MRSGIGYTTRGSTEGRPSRRSELMMLSTNGYKCPGRRCQQSRTGRDHGMSNRQLPLPVEIYPGRLNNRRALDPSPCFVQAERHAHTCVAAKSNNEEPCANIGWNRVIAETIQRKLPLCRLTPNSIVRHRLTVSCHRVRSLFRDDLRSKFQGVWQKSSSFEPRGSGGIGESPLMIERI